MRAMDKDLLSEEDFLISSYRQAVGLGE
jgi:hypothetical protein